MNVLNLDVGVRRALTAYLTERGDGDAAATKAEKHLAAGMATVTAAFEAIPQSAKARDGGAAAWGQAFAALKVWARTTIPA